MYPRCNGRGLRLMRCPQIRQGDRETGLPAFLRSAACRRACNLPKIEIYYSIGLLAISNENDRMIHEEEENVWQKDTATTVFHS